MTRIGWLDCSSGVSGDMLLGALTALGAVDVAAVARALGVSASVTVTTTTRGGLGATQVVVHADDEQPHRHLAEVIDVITAAALPAAVTERATAVFRRLAVAEAAVHAADPETVAFHEVGAVDAIVDIVGACTGLHALALDRLVVAAIALGGGRAQTMHGPVPVPAPAVLELLKGTALTAYGGPVDRELATPTGVALVAEWAADAGAMPAMQVERLGVGAGGRDLPEQPNVLRLAVGTATAATPSTDTWQLLEANVDDLDPRLWPVVLERLLAAGAADAWVTPIVMKKGRPAHTVSALCAGAVVATVRRVLFVETSTIGVRSVPVGKTALDRDWLAVDVDGQTVRVKIARLVGEVVNASPEFDDVVRAAAALDRPVKTVLAAAAAAAHARLA